MKNYTPKNGDWITCTIDRVKVKNARISITQFGIFLCHNHRTIKATKAFNPPKFGFNFSTKISYISEGKTQIWKKIKDLKEAPPYRDKNLMKKYKININIKELEPRKFKVGDAVRIKKPEDTLEEPGWPDLMNAFDGQVLTLRIGGNGIWGVQEDPNFSFSEKWMTPVFHKPKLYFHDIEEEEIEKRYASKESFENHILKLQLEEQYNIIEKLKKDLEAAKQTEGPKSWPQAGNSCYYWNAVEEKVDCTGFQGFILETELLARGELFPTFEECEEDDKNKRALTRIKDFIRKEGLEFVPDWKDKKQNKYSIDCYSHDVSAFTIEEHNYLQYNSLYFKEREHAKLVLQACAADLKILFGIK